MSHDNGDGFLTRWARRKAETQRVEPVAPPVAAESVDAPETAEAEPEFDVTTLPPLESLTAASDITAFLQKNVPAALRNAALQKMWVMDESIRTYIGPSEMSWDFNAPGAIFGHGPIAADSDLAGMLADIADHRWLKPAEEPQGADTPQEVVVDDAIAIAAPSTETDVTDPAEALHETKVEEKVDFLPVRQRHGGATPQ